MAAFQLRDPEFGRGEERSVRRLEGRRAINTEFIELINQRGQVVR